MKINVKNNNYYTVLKAVKDGKVNSSETFVIGEWNEELSFSQIRSLFRKALNRKINRNLPIPGKKWNSDYQTALLQDSLDVKQKLEFRLRFYQFRTKEFSQKLSHLLSERGE